MCHVCIGRPRGSLIYQRRSRAFSLGTQRRWPCHRQTRGTFSLHTAILSSHCSSFCFGRAYWSIGWSSSTFIFIAGSLVVRSEAGSAVDARTRGPEEARQSSSTTTFFGAHGMSHGSLVDRSSFRTKEEPKEGRKHVAEDQIEDKQVQNQAQDLLFVPYEGVELR